MKSIPILARLRSIRRLLLTAGLAGAAFAAAPDASAQQTVWLGGTGNWSDMTKWNKGVPNGNTADAFVDDGKSVVSFVSVDGNYTVGRLTISTGDTVSLDNAQSFTISDSGGFAGAGTLFNSGTFTMASTGNYTDLDITGTTTLTGGGTVNLSQADRVYGGGTLINVNNTIQGDTSAGGAIGYNEALTLQNQAKGVINANNKGAYLDFDPGASSTNAGTLEASNGGILDLDGSSAGPLTNTGGLIQALTGSQVNLIDGVQITGGTLSTTGTGTINNVNSNTVLSGVTSTGSLIINNATNLTLEGTITNTGTLTIDSTGNYTDLYCTGTVMLTGGGTISITNAGRIFGESTGKLVNVDNVIEGDTNNGGAVGYNQTLDIDNQVKGVIDANTSGLYLDLNPSSNGLTNEGLLEASNGGILQLDGTSAGPFTNTGTIQALPGSTVKLIDGATFTNLANNTLTGGTYKAVADTSGTMATLDFAGATFTTNAATVVLNGRNSVFAAITPLLDNQGTFTLLAQRDFTTSNDLSNEGELSIGPGSTLHDIGDYNASAKSTLAITVGGTASTGSKSPGILQVGGNANIAGKLTVNFTSAATLPAFTAEVPILSASAVNGTFANVTNGHHVKTSDGKGFFVVNYGPQSAFSPTQVVLSKFTTESMPEITSPLTVTGYVGEPFSYTITASEDPTIFAALGLKDGLSLNSKTGVISGTPTAAETFNLTIKATNQYGPVTATLAVTIKIPPPTITSTLSATTQVGKMFSYQIKASSSPTSFNATGLPTGFSVNKTTGQITGTPTAADVGTFKVTISAANSTGPGTATLTLTVHPATPVVSSPATATATVGDEFKYQITASSDPTSFGVLGLFAGITLNKETGLISGTPTSAGTHTLTLQAINAGGTGTKTLTLTVQEIAPAITSSTTATAQVGKAFSYQITAAHGPTSFGVSGLRSGLSVDTTTGLISGTPTGSGTFTLVLRATNAKGSDTQNLTLTIKPSTPQITSADTATATVGKAFSYQIKATSSPTSYGVLGLITGLTVNKETGLISGTPTGTGTHTLTLQATNAGGTGTKVLTLTVAAK